MGVRYALLLAAVALTSACSSPQWWQDLWFTRDQQGARLVAEGDYAAAAQRFTDPMRRGLARYHAEQFDAAITEWSALSTAESWFCRGNALAHLAEYEEAVAAYEQALALRPDYPEAAANLDYLQPFMPLDFEGGITGAVGRDAAADEVVFDAAADRLEQEGRDTDEESGLISSEQMAEMWLQQVDVSPAAFLRHKFRYQAAAGRSQ